MRMRTVSGKRRGFSLAELLTVLGIIGVLVTLAVPALKGVSESGAMTQALTRIGGTLDQARAYAVANNTHAWVAFTENAESGESWVEMVAFASRTGLGFDTGSANAAVQYPQDARIELISPVEKIRQIRLDGAIPEENALNSDDALPQAKEVADFAAADRGLHLQIKDKAYTRSIHFHPGGEASITTAIPEVIQIVVMPEKNAGATPSERDRRQATVIRVSGLTGQAIIYQPR